MYIHICSKNNIYEKTEIYEKEAGDDPMLPLRYSPNAFKMRVTNGTEQNESCGNAPNAILIKNKVKKLFATNLTFLAKLFFI